MTISVLFIEGSRKSACRQDAYSVVRNNSEVLTIVPQADLAKAHQNRTTLELAFNAAEACAPGAPAQAVTTAAKKLLGLTI